jgi:hypothetical protein
MTQNTTTPGAFDEPGSLVGTFDDYVPTEEGFGRPFIDVDDWRDDPRRHRFVHGGFEGTHTLFTLYLPPAEHFTGRVLKHLEGGAGGHETLLAGDVGLFTSWMFNFAYEEFGAILMESNQGHYHDEGLGFHADVLLFGASAESARFAKWLAPQLYGQEVHHSYVFGASGGGHRSYQCLINRGDVFDGGVPEVCGANPGIYWSIQALAIALLGDQLPAIADRCEPGGGDPFEGLSFDQREALADLFRMGYPMPAVNQLQTLAAPFTLYNTKEQNPGYFEDFWTKPGYLGHDDPQRLASRRVNETVKVTEIVKVSDVMGRNPGELMLLMAGAAPEAGAAVKLDVEDPRRLYMSWMTVKTGKAAGRKLVAMVLLPGGAIAPFLQASPELFEGVEPGDEIELDNADWLAFNYLYKHNVEWNVPGVHTDDDRVPGEYADFAVDGLPIHEQTGTTLYDLNVLKPFTSKMIVIASGLDCMIWPTFMSPLDRHIRATLGDAVEGTYRLQWVENATHGPPEMMGPMGISGEMDPRVWRTRLVDYGAPAAQALLDVKAWVEEGTPPPPDTGYSFTRNNQLRLPPAGERGGCQPIVALTVDGGVRADVKVGQEVRLQGTATQPTGTGYLRAAEIDIDSTDQWPYQVKVEADSESVDIDVTHTYDTPGTYFPCFRVGAVRAGRPDTALPVQNLARVRVVVT